MRKSQCAATADLNRLVDHVRTEYKSIFNMIDSIHIILITFLFGLFGFMVFIIRNFVGKPDQSTSGPDEDNEVKPTELLQPKTKKKSHVNEKRTTNVKDKFNHPWLFTTLKGISVA